MLLTDSGVLLISDLQDLEADIQAVANANGLDLDRHIASAMRELRVEVQSFLTRATNIIFDPSRVTTYLYGGDSTGTRVRSEQIVVTDALKFWLSYRALERIFRDAWQRKQADKYEAKYDGYKEDAEKARERTFNEGIAVVSQPLPQPGKPALTAVAGGSQGVRTYDVQITWENADADKSAPSLLMSLQVAASQLLKVDITALVPPNEEVLSAGQTPIVLGKATGWNVYAGLAGAARTRQTATATAIATKTWTEPASGLIAGAAVGVGQDPDYYRTVGNMVMRG